MLKQIINILLLITFISCVSLAKETTLVLNTWTTAPLSTKTQSGYLDKVLLEAFKRININLKIVKKPVERSISDANSGSGDGEFIRVAGLSKIYPNLTMVPEELFEFEFVAFSNNHHIQVENWDKLKPYTVAIVIGWKIFEKNVNNVKKRHDIASPKSLFKMIQKRRIDMGLYSKYAGKQIIKDLKLKNIFIVSPPLATKKMYLYLHKKHQSIIPLLTKVLKEMKKDGTFNKIKDMTLLND